MGCVLTIPREWSNIEDGLLRDWRRNGLRMHEIAIRLGRTLKSVQARSQKLCLPYHIPKTSLRNLPHRKGTTM